MIETIFEALFGSLIKWAFGWLQQREAARAATKKAEQIQQAEVAESTDRDTTAKQVEADRENTDAQLDRVQRDAAGPDSVQLTHEDAASAIDAANAGVRRA